MPAAIFATCDVLFEERRRDGSGACSYQLTDQRMAAGNRPAGGAGAVWHRKDEEPSGDGGKCRGALIVQIDPLERERVRTFAERRGIENPDQFLAELDNHSAWEFARRPLDVLDLAAFWMANRRLGSLTEIIEHDVTTKLRETVERRANFPLSEVCAREGAECARCRHHSVQAAAVQGSGRYLSGSRCPRCRKLPARRLETR